MDDTIASMGSLDSEIKNSGGISISRTPSFGSHNFSSLTLTIQSKNSWISDVVDACNADCNNRIFFVNVKT